MRKRRRKASEEFDPLKWLPEKLERLGMEDYIKKIKANFDKNELYKAHLWTPLKLIALMWWLTVYSRIIPKYFSNYYYIDLLASSGANFIKETGDIILGSPLLSFLIPHEPFKFHIFIEYNLQKCRTLDKMLKHFGFSNYKILRGDCNERVYDIPFNDIDHYFCFVDCEGLEVKWQTVKHLLQYHGDILFVFQTDGANRVFGKAKKRGHNIQALDDFCGGDWWKTCDTIDQLLAKYKDRVKYTADSLRGFKNFVDHVKVRGRYSYDVILICREGEYTKAWLDLKRKLEKVSDRDVDIALKICKGEIKTLSEFFERKQTKLDQYFT